MDQFGFAFYIYYFRYFLPKKGNYFEVATFRGSLLSGERLSGFAITCEILSLLSEGRYFRNFINYASCIRSIMDHVVPGFHFRLPKYLMRELERVQKRAMSIISSALIMRLLLL